jgi:DNA-binding beta-propeller fold protein YncE
MKLYLKKSAYSIFLLMGFLLTLGINYATAAPITYGTITRTLPYPPGGVGGLTFSNGFIYSVENYDGNIHKIDPMSGNVVSSYRIPVSSMHNNFFNDLPTGIANDGTDFYLVTNGRDNLRELSLATEPEANILSTQSLPHWPKGLTYADGYLYYPDYLGPIYKIDPANGRVVSSIPSPSDTVYGLTFDGEYLLAAQGPGGFAHGTFWQISPDTGDIVNTWTKPYLSGIYGLAFDQDTDTLYVGTGRSGIMAMNAAPVPVPAAVWLFGSGLIGLIGIGMRKNKTQQLYKS